MWTACIPPICSECCCLAHLRNPLVRAYHRCAHHHTLAARSGADLLQTGRPGIPSHPRHRTYISAVMFHSSCRHDVKTTAAILSLSATGSDARSSHYRRQAGVPSFCSQRMKQFTTSRHICTVSRNLQAESQDISMLQNHTGTFKFDSLFPVDLAIINII